MASLERRRRRNYDEVFHGIVEFEQGGKKRAVDGDELTERLGEDLTASFGRGFSSRNLRSMRLFDLTWPNKRAIGQTASARSPAISPPAFPLPWSYYVTLLAVENEGARAFDEREALAGGWTTRQLKRQVGSRFFERAALSSVS
jgi:hypothetical protein